MYVYVTHITIQEAVVLFEKRKYVHVVKAPNMQTI